MMKWKSRYIPINHEYGIDDEDGRCVAILKAIPGTDRDRLAARLIAAAPDLLAALWVLVGDSETEKTACMSAEEKLAMARRALKLAGGDANEQMSLVTAILG